MFRGIWLAALLCSSVNLGAQNINDGGTMTSAGSDQQVPVVSDPAYQIGVGVQIGAFGGSISVENAEGRKVNPDFWALPTYGAVIQAPFGAGSNLGARLDIGVSSVGTRTRPYEFYDNKKNWEGYFLERYTYFTIAPQVNLAGVLLGVGFNFPMSGERWHPEGSDTKYAVDKDILVGTAMDVRLGGVINVWETKLGKLNVEILARYMFTGLFEDDQYIYGHETTSTGVRPNNYATLPAINLTTASAHIGVSYLFSLGF